MSYRIVRTYDVSAAHRLPDHDGKCSRQHGHNYTVEVHVSAPGLVSDGPQRGMVVDYGRLDDVVEPILDEYVDHRNLNATLDADEPPTAEVIAEWLYKKIGNMFGATAYDVHTPPSVSVDRVVVYETERARAVYPGHH